MGKYQRGRIRSRAKVRCGSTWNLQSPGRIAVSAAHSDGRHYGWLRAAAEGGGVMLIIDAKNDRAAQWYASYGAAHLNDNPLTLVMSLASFAADLKAAGQL